MAYAPPESTHICPCHDRGSNPADCETGHVSECHYPFDCRVAACGHFPLHEYTELESEAIERRAENLLTNSADQDCPHCGGLGLHRAIGCPPRSGASAFSGVHRDPRLLPADLPMRGW